MKKNLVIGFVMLLTALFSASLVMSEMPGSDADALWNYITKDSPYQKWSFWPDHQGIQDGRAPHGPRHKVYVNDKALTSTAPPLQYGSIQVKENFNMAGELKTIKGDDMTAVLLFHPVIQEFATLLAIYVLWLGLQRFRSLHWHQKVDFKWKSHVNLGIVTLGLWLAGLIGGLIMVRIWWHGFLVTGIHGKLALVMLPLLLFGLFSGLYMDRRKKKRKFLPLLHGTNNLLLLIMALYQAYTGWLVYSVHVLGG